jgi:anti-sigma factor RsiW
MSCDGTRLALLDYLHGELEGGPAARIELHLASCPACAAETARLRREMERYVSLCRLPVPEDLEQRVMSRLRSLSAPGSAERLRSMIRFAVTAAAAFALALTGLAVISPPAYAMVVSAAARFGAQVNHLASEHVHGWPDFERLLNWVRALLRV